MPAPESAEPALVPCPRNATGHTNPAICASAPVSRTFAFTLCGNVPLMKLALSFTSTAPSLLRTRWNWRARPATASFTWKVSLSGPVDGGPPGLTVHGPDRGQHVTRRPHPDP